MKNNFVLGLFVVLVSSCKQTLTSISYEDIGFLTNLTHKYDPKIRPVFKRSEPTTVFVAMGLKSIISLDEKEEVISCNLWFSLTWSDMILRWNVTENTPPFLHISVSEVWSPTVLLQNSVSELIEISRETEPVSILNNGLVSYSYLGRTDTRCKVNIQKFPFDKQVCVIQLSTPLLSSEYLAVRDSTVNLDVYDGDGEFDLLDAKLTLEEIVISKVSLEMVFATLTMERRTTFYILNNILPVVFLSFLNTFAFLLPDDSGEKMTFCISILLSYAVFLTLINSYLPENSDHVCFLSVYLAMLVLISTLTCLATLFILALQSRLQKEKGFPKWLRFLSSKNNIVQAVVTDDADKAVERFEAGTGAIRKLNSIAFGTFFLITILSNCAFFGVILL